METEYYDWIQENTMNAARSAKIAQKIRGIFHIAAALHLTSNMFPKSPILFDEKVYDYIIVGGGTAGCVIANRLSELKNVSILLLEAGDPPPMESIYPRYYPYLKKSFADWNFTAESKSNMKYLEGGRESIPQGRMLGGTSGLNYMIYARGNVLDYMIWATIANDTSWLYEKVMPYFMKNERLIDEEMLKSPDTDLYGKMGRIKLRRYFNDMHSLYMGAFKELGKKTLLNVNSKHPLGFCYCLFSCSKSKRQDSANIFLKPIKKRTRLHVKTNALVNRVIFDAHNTAVGVNVFIDDRIITIMAREEVILAAGVFNTPQLLMLSGIGPKNHLRKLNIKMRVHLPVGEGLRSAPAVPMVFRMGESQTRRKRSNPHHLDFPILDGQVAMHKHDFPDYIIRSYIFDDPSEFLEFCVVTLSYIHEVCDNLYTQTVGKQIYVAMNQLAYPKSSGRVLLRSSDIKDDPIIKLGFYNKAEDLDNHAIFLMDYYRIKNTTLFTSVYSKYLRPKLVECDKFERTSLEYWKCYALAMATSAHNYSGTSAIGKVVNTRLFVRGVRKLRVADASVIPNILSAPVAATVLMIAEKAAAMIKRGHMRRKAIEKMPIP